LRHNIGLVTVFASIGLFVQEQVVHVMPGRLSRKRLGKLQLVLFR